ncbi:MAG: bifunctional demethylmenaquinone methyltransferase/2-methoxy-6-polyprenyl-1,4-benzoquinol methylase UbiE [Alistipes sp.]|nr:bifunctional demethylmenaquinone methyltransferase/2-methoxy-6-polyprenyl-1,4-benzoquinol methylase UbiE [Alistipes sp.]
MKPYDTDQSKTEQVRDMFDRIAPTYDTLNHTLSLNVDRWWRRRTVDVVERLHPARILDIATGTGDLAIAMAHRIPGARVTGVDPSEGMLDVARRKVAACGLDERIGFVTGAAEELAAGDASFDAATVAFGVRNFGDIAAGLRQIARALRRGGSIVVLEFSTPPNPIVRWGYGIYSHRILPAIGGLVSRDRAAYRYLPESVDEFPAPERFLDIMREVGFDDCSARSLSFGIAHIYIGVKR